MTYTLTTRSTKRRNRMMKALDPKYAARTAAHTKLDDATKAVERAKRIEAAAADHLRSFEQRAASAEGAAATQMAEMIAKGGLESVRSIPDQGNEQLDQALSAARRDHGVRAKALATLEAARDEAQAGLAQAERAVVQAVDQALDAEREDTAAQIERLYAQLSNLVGVLRESTPDPINTPINVSIVLSPAVELALSRVPPPDDTRTPVNVLRGLAPRLGAVANHEPWVQRRSRLIAGEASEEATAA